MSDGKPLMHMGRLEVTPVPICEECGHNTRAVGGVDANGKRRYQCTNYANCSNKKYYTRESSRRG